MNKYKYDAISSKYNNDIGNHIAKLRKERNLTQQGLAEKLSDFGVNVKNTAINKWETGNTTPTAYQIIAICFALGVTDMLSEFAGIIPSPDPDLNEKGLQKLSEYRDLLILSGKYKPEVCISKPFVANIKIPTSSIKAAAGTGNFMDEENFEDQEYPENVVPPGTDFAVLVDGDSMSPIYANGQVIFVKQCNSVEPGQVGIFSIDNEVVVKIYDEEMPSESDIEEYVDSNGIVHPQVVLRSYNSDWKPRLISPYQEFHVFGRVLN